MQNPSATQITSVQTMVVELATVVCCNDSNHNTKCIAISFDFTNNSGTEKHFADIQSYANVIESRLDDSDLNQADLIAENEYNLAQCIAHNLSYILIDKEYKVE